MNGNGNGKLIDPLMYLFPNRNPTIKEIVLYDTVDVYRTSHRMLVIKVLWE